MINIGFAGYSAQGFDTERAQLIIEGVFTKLQDRYGEFEVVSGLTDCGIPAMVYAEGSKRGLRLIGIACKKAKDYDLYPVDETIIVGDNWGDESETFLESIDILVRIGGGKQSLAEEQRAIDLGMEVLSYDLNSEN